MPSLWRWRCVAAGTSWQGQSGWGRRGTPVTPVWTWRPTVPPNTPAGCRWTDASAAYVPGGSKANIYGGALKTWLDFRMYPVPRKMSSHCLTRLLNVFLIPCVRRCGQGDTLEAWVAASSSPLAGYHWGTSPPCTGRCQTALRGGSDAAGPLSQWTNLKWRREKFTARC